MYVARRKYGRMWRWMRFKEQALDMMAWWQRRRTQARDMLVWWKPKEEVKLNVALVVPMELGEVDADVEVHDLAAVVIK